MSATFTRVPQMFWVPSRNFHFFDGINRFWKKILCWLEKCQWNGVINCVHPFYNTMSCPWSILSFARRVMYMTTWLYYDSMIALEFHSTNPQEGVSSVLVVLWPNTFTWSITLSFSFNAAWNRLPFWPARLDNSSEISRINKKRLGTMHTFQDE